jgi:Flp pilus assembly protein TadD
LKKRIAAVSLAVLLLLAAISAISHVGSHEAAVLDPRFGNPVVLPPGFHFHAPFLTRVTHYELEARKVEGKVKVETRDNLNFRVLYSLKAAVDPDALLALHARRAGRPLSAVLRQLSDETVRSASSLLRADEILGTAPRERWAAALVPPSKERGLKIEDIKITPVEPRVMVNTALVYEERRLPNAALQIAMLGVKRFPKEAGMHYGLGRIYEYQGRPSEAEEEYIQALLLDPAAREPMGRLIGALLKRREFDRARRLLDAALEKNAASAPHYNWLGITLQLEAKYVEAEQAIQKAVQLDPKNAGYRAGLGALYLAKGEPARAEQALKEAIRLKPDFGLALYNLGVALAMSGKPAEALPFLERAEQTGPVSVGLLNALARAYQEAGQSPKAIAALERSLRLQPAQPEQQKLLSQLRSKGGSPPRRSAR